MQIKPFLKNPLHYFLLIAFLLFSWPFIGFPLTDGDIVNWSQVSVELAHTHNFFEGGNDQGHGPLMAWTGTLFILLCGKTMYSLNLFNLLIGVLGVWFTYFFASQFWKDEKVAKLSCFLYLTSIAPVYLSRTPMYDWPAAILIFGFCGFYYLSQRDNKRSFLGYALLLIGIASLSRFSISWGLAGIYMIGIRLFVLKSLPLLIRDGLLITAATALFNLPWMLGQVTSHGTGFIETFIYDNTGRYVKSTRPDAHFRADFYGFTLYTLFGMLPFTFCIIASFFKKSFMTHIKENKEALVCLIGFLPCLLLFSFSGHTKLGRYIAYIFPFLILLLAHLMVTVDLLKESYRKRCGTMLKWTAGLLLILLVQQTMQFQSDAETAIRFVVAVFALLFSLLYLAYRAVVKHYALLRENPENLLTGFSLCYGVFFTILAIEMHHAPFLIWVREGIESILSRY